jgi:hypothetical protein
MHGQLADSQCSDLAQVLLETLYTRLQSQAIVFTELQKRVSQLSPPTCVGQGTQRRADAT